jgi:CRISPR/Cas system-associated endonuclease Cas1
VNVTTKVYAKKLYQWKFGTLSKAYKTYIRSRRGSDNGVNYVLSDGTTLTGGKEEDLDQITEGI